MILLLKKDPNDSIVNGDSPFGGGRGELLEVVAGNIRVKLLATNEIVLLAPDEICGIEFDDTCGIVFDVEGVFRQGKLSNK